MTRQLLTKTELQDWMTTEIQKFEGCESCKFVGITSLQETDQDGCNWSDSISLSTGGVHRHVYESAARAVIQLARSKFNVIK